MSKMPERIPGGGVDLSHLAARGARAAGAGAAGAGAPGAAGAAGAGAAGSAAGLPAASPNPAAQGPAQGQVIPVPSLVLDVTDQTFEQVAQLSAVVPVVFDLWAEWCGPCKQLGPIIEKVTREHAGRVLLAKVDVDANQGLAQAFQAQSIPTVVALVGGRPVPLFQGALPEAQVRAAFEQLLQLAEQVGVVGRVQADAADAAAGEDAAPQVPEIPEAHLPAVEAAERGDYETAIAEWKKVLQHAPADQVAHASLAQVQLLNRLQGKTADEIRQAGAAAPSDVEAQLGVADLDVAGGHVEDAFLRLLDLFKQNPEQEVRTRIRERLLELFEVVGVTDPRVIAARRQLANLLY